MNLESLLCNTISSCSSITPAGYITVGLSSEGNLGAPILFHCRNFTCEELLNLSLVDVDSRPRYLLDLLQKLILEPDVLVSNFYEKEVIEFIMTLYQIYYGNTFLNMDYEMTDEDWEVLALKYKESPDDFLNAQYQYNSKKWRPKYDIFLDALEYNTLPKDFKKTAIVKNKTGEIYEFSFPKYGDFSLARDSIRMAFAKEDSKFSQLQKKIDLKTDIENRIRKGEAIDINKLPVISNKEIISYNNYQENKSDFINILIRSLLIRNYNGQDVSCSPLEEKIKITTKLDIDYITMKTIIDYFTDLKVGIKPEIKILNPITRKHIIKEYSFSEMEYFNMYEYNNLLTLLCSISKETTNSIESLLKMPMHQVTSIFTSLKTIFEEEEKERKEQEKNQGGSSSPNMPQLPSSYTSMLNSVNNIKK